MKKTLRNFYLALTFVLVMLFGTVMYSGCQTYMNEQDQVTTRLSDEATETLDRAVVLAPVVTDALVGVGLAFPGIAGTLGLVAGIIGGLAGAYKKYRPELTKEQEKAQIYSNTTKAIVYAIEQFKQSNGRNWSQLKGALKDELLEKVGPEALAVIEALIQAYYKEQQSQETASLEG